MEKIGYSFEVHTDCVQYINVMVYIYSTLKIFKPTQDMLPAMRERVASFFDNNTEGF